MSEIVAISTPDHVSLEFELAGPGSRFSAYAVDFVLNMLLIVAIALLFFLIGGTGALRALLGAVDGHSAWGPSWLVALLVLAVFLINWGYYVFFEGLGQGSTPGKKLVGIRVIPQDGLPVGLREAALRNLVRATDMLPPPCYLLDGLVMHFDPYGQRLGDMVAGTYVVVEKFHLAAQGASGAAWATRVEQGRSRQALTLPHGTISPEQLGLVEQFLAWQIEPLLALLGGDRRRLMASADRTEECESILLQIVDLSQQKEAQAQRRQNRAAAGAILIIIPNPIRHEGRGGESNQGSP
jgi:uncharacterized RDD family membrane protein YckC